MKKIFFAVFWIIISSISLYAEQSEAQESEEKQICLRNQRALVGALEMHAVEHEDRMQVLDITSLIKDRYLKTSFGQENEDCKYTLKKMGYLGKEIVICEKHGSYLSKDVCLSNLFFINIAIKKYNNENKMSQMEKPTIRELIHDGILTEEPEYPESNCKYYTMGLFSNGGEIVCQNHGSIFDRISIQEIRKEGCFSNQRVLLGAVEMYNMDNRVMMKNLDIDKLVKGKYLKSAPIKPESACDYFFEGDLTKGNICCKLHGNYNGRNTHNNKL